MRQYEVTFIVDPVLPSDEVKSVAKKYADFLEKNGCTIVHKDEMGLRQLAYPINRRNTGLYYCYEYQTEKGQVVGDIELHMRRDERVMRFLTVKLDKYGIKYNEDKRNGLIAKVEPVVKEKEDNRGRRKKFVKKDKPAPVAKEVKEEVAEAVKETPVVEEVKEEVTLAATPAAKEVKPVVEEVKEEVKKEVVEEKTVVEEVKEEVKEEVAVAATPVVEETKPAVEEVEEEVEEEIEEIEEIFEDWSESKAEDVKPDDLKKVEGIGPKIAELLNNAGIMTFAQLSKTDAEKIKEILHEAGSRYKMHNPTTWPKQAEMAAAGEWDALKKWQDELDGGK